jgi:BlaI family transcriptional regulator, penicillinase repressor
MKKAAPPRLTALQLAVLRVLWAQGEATVAEVQQRLAGRRRLALTTVATLLSRLEKRGVVAYRTEGRQYVYRALVDEAQVCRSALADVTERVFAGDVATLVSALLSSDSVRPGDLARVKALIEEKERELRRRRS